MGKKFNDIRPDNRYVPDLREWGEHGREQALPYRKLTKELSTVSIPKYVYCVITNFLLNPLANKIKDRGISKIFRVYKVRLTVCPVIINQKEFLSKMAKLCSAQSLTLREENLWYLISTMRKFIYSSSEVKEIANVIAVNEDVKMVLFELIKFNGVLSVDSSSVT